MRSAISVLEISLGYRPTYRLSNELRLLWHDKVSRFYIPEFMYWASLVRKLFSSVRTMSVHISYSRLRKFNLRLYKTIIDKFQKRCLSDFFQTDLWNLRVYQNRHAYYSNSYLGSQKSIGRKNHYGDPNPWMMKSRCRCNVIYSSVIQETSYSFFACILGVLKGVVNKNWIAAIARIERPTRPWQCSRSRQFSSNIRKIFH